LRWNPAGLLDGKLIVGNLTLSAFAVTGPVTQGVPMRNRLGHLMDRFDTPEFAIPFALVAAIGIIASPLMIAPIFPFAAILIAGVVGRGKAGHPVRRCPLFWPTSLHCNLRLNPAV
jgi:hypothetical protein